jgi:hypothetical protein
MRRQTICHALALLPEACHQAVGKGFINQMILAQRLANYCQWDYRYSLGEIPC